jgi:hypothetical protein
MIEMEHLFAVMEVVHDEGPASADTQRVLVVSHWTTLGGRQHVMPVFGELVELPAFPAMELLIMDRYGVGRSLRWGRLIVGYRRLRRSCF